MTSAPASEFTQLVTWIETCRDMGRGALSADLPTVYREIALDHLDRTIDNILSRVNSMIADEGWAP